MKFEINIKEIPKHEADRLASSLLRTAERLFEDPRIQAEFEAWQQRKRQQKERKGA